MLPSLPARVAREEAALAASLARERASTLPPGPQRDGVRLALLPALLQYLLDRGAMTTEHVGYQMMERLCLGAIGRENMYPTSRYDNLRDYSQALRFHGGTAVLHLLHGQGYAGAAPTVGEMGRATGHGKITATEYLARHNTGIFHPDTVKRSLSTVTSEPGLQPHEMLNLFEGLRMKSGAVTWEPRDEPAGRKKMYAVVAKMDGMLLGKGAAVVGVHEEELEPKKIWGFRERRDDFSPLFVVGFLGEARRECQRSAS